MAPSLNYQNVDSMAKNILILFVCAAGSMGLFSCSKSAAPPQPSILSFSPTSGPVGTTVTITGTNLKPASANSVVQLVRFNGTAAIVISLTSTSITTTVPAGATTGAISVSVNGETSSSSSSFTVF